LLRKLKRQIPGEPLAVRLMPAPGTGPRPADWETLV